MRLRIQELTFQAGAVSSGPSLVVPIGNLCLLVGPNNSGKSRALEELANQCGPHDDLERRVIRSISVAWPETLEDAVQLIEELVAAGSLPTTDSYEVVPLPLSVLGEPGWVDKERFRQEIETASSEDAERRVGLLAPRTAIIGGVDRHRLVAEQNIGDLVRPSQTPMVLLLADDERRNEIREIIHEALGGWLVLDCTRVGAVRARWSAQPPPGASVERSFEQAAVEFHNDKPMLAEQSAGTQSFVGLVIGAFTARHSVLLIDEAEAFLDPATSRRLGNALARAASERDGTLIAATHSSEFLIGALEAAVDPTIVRLTYESTSGAATARALSASAIRPLMRDPLLRSSSALDGLFHRAVIVTEADADRAFYNEMNRRLQDVGRGVSDALFINAQNWQTEARLIRPLREAGIPAAAILDIDALVDGNPTQWSQLYAAAGLDGQAVDRLEVIRIRAQAALQTGGREVKKGGVGLLGGEDRIVVETAIAELADVGLFLVPVGSLESWLPELRAREPKRHWIVDVFDRIGDDPLAPGYVVPGADDVWKFVDAVARWCLDPNREGIPE